LLLELEAGGIGVKISAGNASELLDRIGVVDETIRYRILVARELVGDIARLDTTPRASRKRIAVAVQASGTSLTDIYGVGPYGAATIIGYTKDITRFPTKGHYATYNATTQTAGSISTRRSERARVRKKRSEH
jgi:transposase